MNVLKIEVIATDPNVIRFCAAQRFAIALLCEWLGIDENLGNVALEKALDSVADDPEGVLVIEKQVCHHVAELAGIVETRKAAKAATTETKKPKSDEATFIEELLTGRGGSDEEAN